MSNPVNAANAPNTGPDKDNLAPSQRQLELRCQLLDIERRGAIWRCEEFRKLLSPYLGESTAELPAGGSRSAPAQVAPSLATSAQQHHYVRPASPPGELCAPSSCLLPSDRSSLSLSRPLARVCAPRCQVVVPRRIAPQERREFIQVTEPAAMPHRESTRCPQLTL
ncbi:hypothetical protein BJV78DRAFT_221463 [Lactifluus subvellereus]|nr:hypothetical protein BJV78DRAFT_221463 [Lactifluus subvellereus]